MSGLTKGFAAFCPFNAAFAASSGNAQPCTEPESGCAECPAKTYADRIPITTGDAGEMLDRIDVHEQLEMEAHGFHIIP